MTSLQANLDKDVGEEAIEENQVKWGMQLSEIYRLSMKFYKGS